MYSEPDMKLWVAGAGSVGESTALGQGGKRCTTNHFTSPAARPPT